LASALATAVVRGRSARATREQPMPNWDQKFKAEYDYLRAWLQDANFTEGWRPLVRELKQLMSDTGFESARAESLTSLRAKSRQDPAGRVGKMAGRDETLLTAVGSWQPHSAGKVGNESRMRAAVLKMLCHVYLLNASGNREVWLHNLPDDFKQWASDALNDCGTDDDVKALLRSSNERFGFDARKHFASAAQHGLAWCQKTSIVLANAANADNRDPDRGPARDLVRRWFADPSVTETDLDGFIGTLSTGFKNITATINSGRIILTDWVPLRGATSEDDLGWRASNAFTFASRREGLDVVYIEEGFFTHPPSNVFSGQKHYNRIFVHELTHLVAGTADVNRGGSRYAWRGIGPHAGYPGSDCIRNADNWACFAADCAGAMTAGERAKALKII
jgi:hypothetical protein